MASSSSSSSKQQSFHFLHRYFKRAYSISFLTWSILVPCSDSAVYVIQKQKHAVFMLYISKFLTPHFALWAIHFGWTPRLIGLKYALHWSTDAKSYCQQDLSDFPWTPLILLTNWKCRISEEIWGITDGDNVNRVNHSSCWHHHHHH